jgi:hypothetical protein
VTMLRRVTAPDAGLPGDRGAVKIHRLAGRGGR